MDTARPHPLPCKHPGGCGGGVLSVGFTHELGACHIGTATVPPWLAIRGRPGREKVRCLFHETVDCLLQFSFFLQKTPQTTMITPQNKRKKSKAFVLSYNFIKEKRSKQPHFPWKTFPAITPFHFLFGKCFVFTLRYFTPYHNFLPRASTFNEQPNAFWNFNEYNLRFSLPFVSCNSSSSKKKKKRKKEKQKGKKKTQQNKQTTTTKPPRRSSSLWLDLYCTYGPHTSALTTSYQAPLPLSLLQCHSPGGCQNFPSQSDTHALLILTVC